MSELLAWLADAHTDLQKGGQIALVIFFLTFCGILIYVFTGGKRRRARFDSYRYIPLDDEEGEASGGPNGHQQKGTADHGE